MLILRVASEFATDAVSKSPIVPKVLSEEIIELSPRHRVLGFGATFVLMPSLNHCSAEKRGGERDAVGPVGPSSFEMVFTLLAKAVAVQWVARLVLMPFE